VENTLYKTQNNFLAMVTHGHHKEMLDFMATTIHPITTQEAVGDLVGTKMVVVYGQGVTNPQMM
jgi:hypothetical protein